MNRRFLLIPFLLLAPLLISHPAGAGDIIVKDGAQLKLHDKTLNLNCGDITVTNGGNVDLGTGVVQGSRNMSSDSSSTLELGTATVNLCNTPPPPLPTTGALQVDIEPDAVGASWSLSGPATKSGTGDQTLTDLPEGTYTLTWGAAPSGWNAPLADTLSFALPAGAYTTLVGTYKALDADKDGTPDSLDTGDSDGDGLSDAWETARNLNPAVNEGLMDRDQDGYSDLRELLSGTDPGDKASTPAPATVYVKAGGTGNGTNWDNAFGSLQTAIYFAAPGETVWVQAGTYIPAQAPNHTAEAASREYDSGSGTIIEPPATEADPRNRHFALKPGVTLAGGFAGTETSLSQRDILANPTVLSGDLEQNDNPADDATLTDNAYHVIYHPADVSSWMDVATLDGIVISGGNAQAAPGATVPTESLRGGGLYLAEGSFRILRCRIENNQAEEGGGIYIGDANVELINSVLAKNHATTNGGGYTNSGTRPQTIRSCTLIQNSADQNGGGVYGMSSSPLTIDSSLFWNNTASNSSYADWYILSTWPTSTQSFCWISSGVDPLFEDATNGNYALQAGSPVVDGGNPEATATFHATTDMAGSPRFDGPLDIGAFEFPTSATLADGDDEDGDGLTNKAEKDAGLNPRLADSDGDGMDDKFEVDNGLDGLSDDRWKDADGDGFANIREFNEGTIASNPASLPGLTPAWYVKQSSPSTNTGKSWASAWGNPQRAICYAGPGEAVWVANGFYIPTWAPSLPGTTDPRAYHFSLKKGVSVHGGFAGTETSLDQRVATNTTVFAGGGDPNNVTNNLRHVFYHPESLGLDATAKLDRVTISSGNADGEGIHGQGAGMLNLSASPTLTFCRFENNHAASGGAMFNDASSPTLAQCLVIGNETPAISNTENSHTTLINATVALNTGGIINDATSSVRLESTIVWNNGEGSQIVDYGTASEILWSLVGDAKTTPENNPRFTNPVLINGNFTPSDISPAVHTGNPSAAYGADSKDLAGNTRLCGPVDMGAFENHTADTDCDGVKNLDKDANGNGTPDSQEDTDGDGLTALEELMAGTDPSLTDTDGDGLSDYDEVTYGSDPIVSDRWDDTDVDGFSNGREIMEGTPAGDASRFPAKKTIYVDIDASGAANGSSWADAFTDLQTAIFYAASGEEVWVAEGTYVPQASPNAPSLPAPQGYHFAPKNGVSVYGGFSGSETLRSQRNTEAYLTQLSGGNTSWHVLWHKGAGSGEALVDGFTISGGQAMSTNNLELGYGGGVLNQSNLNLNRCKITQNTAYYGGGIYAAGGILTLSNSLITGNTATSSGGGLYYDNGGLDLSFSTLSDNTAATGADAYLIERDVTDGGLQLSNAIIWPDMHIKDTLTENTVSITYSCIPSDLFPLAEDATGNVNAAPSFVNTAGGDYHLQSGSPCRNSGDWNAQIAPGTLDLAGSPRKLCTVDMGTYEYQGEADSDGDGTPNCNDPFPSEPGETTDTDGDGVGDNADTDADGDGMPDAWELAHGLDPLSSADAVLDADGDGTSNREEYILGTLPDNSSSHPARAVRMLPAPGATTGLAPTLTARYGDGTIMGTHARSRWQIATESSFASPVVDLTINNPLTQLAVPTLALDANTRYFWRVRFEDRVTLWSETGSFTTEAQEIRDSNYNGVPDAQEACRTEENPDVLCLPSLPVKVALTDDSELRQVEEMTLLEPETINDDRNVPSLRPNWMLGFQAEVDIPGETVTLTFTSDTPIPEDIVWAKYDAARGWQDFSDKVRLDASRTRITLTVTDGGPGDADGIANGIIVDPFGPSEGTFPVEPEEPVDPVDPVEPEAPANSSGSSSGFGPCFIGTLENGS